NVLKSLHERTLSHYNAMSQGKDNNLYWVSPSQQRPDIGYLYMLTPIYIGNKLEAQMGIEQTIRLEDFVTTGNLPISITLLDENNEPILRLADGERSATSL
ncbi:MAG: two-component system sensor histidine kinase/response regulator, partial [Serratia symbiotica]|nr:two-component system sensor histidine kinase/response regulator [Serratia symbiotica]